MLNKIFGQYIAKQGDQTDEELERKVQSLLPKGKDLVYLDVGCHDGVKTLRRAKVIGTKNILGIDLKTTGAKLAQKKKIKMYFGDLNDKWPLKSNSIDCITATEVIEHMVDVDAFITQVKRVLKPGGSVIISTDNLAAYHNIVALILGYQPYTGPYISKIYPIGHRPNAKYYKNSSYHQMNPHLNVMTAKALRQLLRAYDFDFQKLLGAGFYPIPHPLSEIFSSVDIYHSSHCIGFAKKK